MTSRDLLSAIGQAEDRYIIEAANTSRVRRGRRRLWTALALSGAAVVLAMALFAGGITGGGSEQEDATPPGTEQGESTQPENVLPDTPPLPLPVYPEGDYYALAYRLNDKVPEVDFPALFEAVLGDTGDESAAVEDYVEANREAYDELMSYGDETLFYSLCYLFPHNRELGGQRAAAVDLALYIVRERFRDNQEFGWYTEADMSDEHLIRMLYQRIGFEYFHGGVEWLVLQPPEVYQMVRAIVSVPELRLIYTGVKDEVLNQQVYLNAICRGFLWVFIYGGTDTELTLQNDTVPAPPSDVCNEYTRWEMVQEEDLSITLTFTDHDTGDFKGRMRYIPSEAEKDENRYAPAEGLIEVEYPEL